MRTLLLASLIALLSAVFAGVSRAGAPINLVRLDPTWGTGGKLTVDVGGPGPYEDEPFWMVRQPDGKFVTAGKARNQTTGSFDFAVMRYNPDGSLDPTFGRWGVALIDFTGGYDEGLAVALQPDGKLVVAGRADRPGGLTDFGVTRLLPNGTRDPSFGWGGIVMTDFFNGSDNALAVAVQNDGKIVVAGFATSPYTGSDFAVVRYNANGSRDASFGWGGLVVTDFFGKTDAITKMFIQPDGKIVGVGMTFSTRDGSYDFAVARYNTNGGRDATFGWGGLVARDFLGGSDVAWASALQPDGKILVGGYAYNPANVSTLASVAGDAPLDAAVMRLNPDGSLDTTFAPYGIPGLVMTDVAGNLDQILWLTIQPDGKILGVGHSVLPTTGFDFALFRYDSDGNLDTTFGDGGHVTMNWFGGPDGLHTVVLQDDGKATVAGDVFNPSTNSDDFALVRFLIADPSWVSGVVSALAQTAFASATAKSDTLSSLSVAGNATSTGDSVSATTALVDLRGHIDGCGSVADANDWITDCTSQLKVRTLVDQIVAKLASP
jgi:uncharacterized delta-60 repeat protein